jgi:hypothetical protein
MRGMSLIPIFGEMPVPVELTLYRPQPIILQRSDGGHTELNANLVVRMHSAADTVLEAAHPQAILHGDEITEGAEIPPEAARRLIDTFGQMHSSAAPNLEDQWAFRYIDSNRRSPRTPPFAHRRKQILDLEGAVELPLEDNRIYAISRGIGQAVFRTFLTLNDPERGLLINARSMVVANTQDITRLGHYITTAYMPPK